MQINNDINEKEQSAHKKRGGGEGIGGQNVYEERLLHDFKKQQDCFVQY